MLQPRATPPLSSHEDLFIQRYQWLMDSALRLTGRDQEEAEDLVHDVFIHFTLDRPDLERLTNLEGYLYTMLRNLHVSQIRRAARIRATTVFPSDLSLADYDFVEDGLRALEERTQDVQDELRRICQYACARRETSKAGSVLILRFFHGYYAAEIAAILRTSRATADKWLQIARSEARVYLRDPNALAFIAKGSTAEPVPVTSTQTTEDFVEQLRKAIFKPEDAKCFGVEQLKRLYSTESTVSIDCDGLSHLVSCAVCLDKVNGLLGLPLFADRYPTKMLRQDTHKKGGGSGRGGSSKGSSGRDSSGGPSGDDFMTRSRRRLKKVIEHRPQQLRVSVNGFILASHDVSSELNKQTVSVKGDEKIGFVEVFSEQEVRLLFANVAPPPDGPAEQSKRVELSEGRELELTVDFAESWPAVHVIYRDPTFAVAKSGIARPEAVVEPKSNASDQPPDLAPQEKASGLRNKVRTLRWDLRFRTPDWRVFLRPATATVIVVALLIVALFVWLRPRVAPVPIADLLARAGAAEEVLAEGNQVIHRTINFEEKKIPGELIARRKIEVWQSAEKGITARRLYDERGALVAGDWRRRDGVETLYQHGSRPQLMLTPEKRSNGTAVLNFENVWHLNLSAQEFADLIGGVQTAIQELSNQYVIIYSSRRDASSDGLVNAALTLSRSDLHAIEQTFLIRQGSETREYRFVETSFERHTPATVAPSVFEPEVELLGKESDKKKVEAAQTMGLSENLPMSPAASTPELEVEVLRLLSAVGADLGEQVSVTRAPDSRLRVDGIVDSVQRKQELLRALQSVATNPAIKIEINTVAEALAKTRSISKPPESVPTEQSGASNDRIPVDDELRQYLIAHGTAVNQLDEQVRQFSAQVLGQSRQTLMYAGALKRLTLSLSAQELKALDQESKAKWLTVVRDRAQSLQQETMSLRQRLGPIFFPTLSSSEADKSNEITNEAELIKAVERLFDETTTNDRVIRSAFAISSEGASASALKGLSFGRSLRNSELLALRVQDATRRLSFESQR